MDIYHFVDSPDIRQHLQKIGYRPNAMETAYLVHSSYIATLDEKLEAWQEILDTMPDCIVEESLHLPAGSSFHALLRQYIQTVQQGVRNFFDGDDCVYSYCFHTPPELYCPDGWGVESPLFRDFAICESLCRQDEDHAHADLVRFQRHRVYADDSYRCAPNDACLYRNPQGNLMLPPFMACGVTDDYDDTLFSALWADIPTPFRCGDIVREVLPFRKGEPHVLYYLPTWDRQTLLERGFPANSMWLQHADASVARCRRTGDDSDMQDYACRYDACEQLWIGDDGFANNYLNLVRVTEPLTGSDRLLYVLRSYLRGEINTEMLANISRLIHLEEHYLEGRRALNYTEDALRAAWITAAD